ncbi:hypothetical protein DM860_006105 [Cuscuta australis]|uniref:Gamma-tubulin complex component n=1 Tax=Cuscuta australis TaxID=267555 RepID=A0A328DP27_9ASTE|nr:hypothetical protein DM860_006105 [Cuscuta australis]
MVLEPSMASLFEKLKVEDPYFPPRPWEYIPSESGLPSLSSLHCEQSSSGLFTSGVSESSLVRLALNALQGVESALISIEKFSDLFCCDSADRSFHRIPSLWSWTSSTLALGNLLKSIGRFGCIIFLLRKFVCYFMNSRADCNSGIDEIHGNNSSCHLNNHTLVNQAFAVSVGRILDGYSSALNTLLSSVNLRRSSTAADGGCLTNVGHSEITILEVYLHTTGLRVQVEALGNICHLGDLALCFPESPLKDLIAKADQEFHNFPRSGALITLLYSQIKATDPVHCALLKFLFIRSWEPYCGFIRSWIYEGKINDPFEEFVVELFDDVPDPALGTSNGFSLARVKVRDGAVVPFFLEDFLIPLFRAGQQLQVIVKLLELSNNIGAMNSSYKEFLPGCNGICIEYHRLSSSLTFDKGTIEAITLARSTFYLQKLEEIDNIFSKFEFRHQGVLPCGVQAIHADCGWRIKCSDLFSPDDNLIISPTEKQNQELPDGVSEASSAEDELSYAQDVIDALAASSSEDSEEQSENEDLTCIPFTDKQLESTYFSALTFITNHSLQKLPQDEISCNPKSVLGEKCVRNDNSEHAAGICYDGKVAREHALAPYIGEQSLLLACDTQGTEMGCPLSDHILENPSNADRRNNENFSLLSMDQKMKVFDDSQLTEMLDYGEPFLLTNTSVQKADSKHQYHSCSFRISSSFSSWKLKYTPNFFNLKPTLTKSSLVKHGEKWHQRKPSSCFDFTHVRDPCKLYMEMLDYRTTKQFGAERSVLKNNTGATAISSSDVHDQESQDLENSEKKGKLSYASSVCSETCSPQLSSLSYTNGGSGWASLLRGCDKTMDTAASYNGPSLVTVNEIPLDYIIKKCLLEEILLQYKYLSKLTIKLFEKGFDLQEHLLALKRYHFMEVADWVDLFITSLLRHKCYVFEAEKRTLEIQGLLELSIQRSSCEADPNRDRVYVYMKDAITNPDLATGSFHGIHSFDFLGLGYRVEWPISIILTPDTLKIYSDIFTFLVQLKLALVSLSDVWSLLKNHTQLSKVNCHFEAQDMKLDHISILTKTRYKLNHFVSAVLQYVQSQFSHVSWCKFMHSLKHKVRDMMDFELVHMAYLHDSQHICFLTEETQPIGHIIQHILQSAVEFRSSMVGYIFKSGLNEKGVLDGIPQIDMSQV